RPDGHLSRLDHYLPQARLPALWTPSSCRNRHLLTWNDILQGGNIIECLCPNVTGPWQPHLGASRNRCRSKHNDDAVILDPETDISGLGKNACAALSAGFDRYLEMDGFAPGLRRRIER